MGLAVPEKIKASHALLPAGFSPVICQKMAFPIAQTAMATALPIGRTAVQTTRAATKFKISGVWESKGPGPLIRPRGSLFVVRCSWSLCAFTNH